MLGKDFSDDLIFEFAQQISIKHRPLCHTFTKSCFFVFFLVMHGIYARCTGRIPNRIP